MDKKIKSKIGWALIAFSIVTTLVIVFTFLHDRAVRDRVLADPLEVTAVIVDIVITYRQPNVMDFELPDEHRNQQQYTRRAYIEYEVDGQTFRARLGWWSNSFRVGHPVDIIVNRANPREFINARQGPEWIGIVVMVIVWVFISGGSAIAGIVLIQIAKRNERRSKMFDGNVPPRIGH